MVYTTSDLTTHPACDALLALAAKARAGLLNRQSNLQFQIANFGNGALLDTELNSVQTQISVKQPFVDALPEGEEKRSEENELLRLQIRRNTLLSRVDSYGAVALIEKQYDLALVNAQLVENAALTAAVQARKDQL